MTAPLVMEAYIRLLLYDWFMRRHDLRALCESISEFPRSRATNNDVSPDSMSHALDIASALYGKQVLCLQRSAVLVKILRKHGVSAQMVIGAQKLPFKAHAWVEVDGKILDDGLASRERFLVLEVF